jgi:hypothetical protein
MGASFGFSGLCLTDVHGFNRSRILCQTIFAHN